MAKKRVLVNLLNQGTVSNGLELQLYLWMKEKSAKYSFSFFEPTERPISNNRNTITKKFLDGDWDILFMLDSDMAPIKNPFDLLDFDKEVIGLVYPGWGDNGIRFHVYKFGDDYPKKIEFKQYEPKERDGLKKVGAIGTGGIAVKRSVLEVIKRPFEDLFDKYGRLITNDDLAFSHKCYQAGIEIWAHWDYLSRHFKTVDLLKVADLVMEAAETGIAAISRPVLRWKYETIGVKNTNGNEKVKGNGKNR